MKAFLFNQILNNCLTRSFRSFGRAIYSETPLQGIYKVYTGYIQGICRVYPAPTRPVFWGYIMMKYKFWTLNNNVLTMKNCFLLMILALLYQNRGK